MPGATKIAIIGLASLICGVASIRATSFEVAVSWAGDVLRLEGKTDLPDGTKLNLAIVDKKDMNTSVSDEIIFSTVNQGKFVASGFVKDKKPFIAGGYGLSIEHDDDPPFLVSMPITIPKRTKSGSAAKVTTARLDTSVTADDHHQSMNEMVGKLQLSGQLRLDCKQHKAWIDPELWNGIDAEAKENFTRAICQGCSSVAGGDSIAIYDAQSAKKLASYREGDGFTAY